MSLITALEVSGAPPIGISPETVKFHLRQVFRKLGIAPRVELARLMAEPPDA